MTTVYIVVYPHPEVRPARRILPFRLDSGASGNDLTTRLCDTYPNHRDDLMGATLRKASHSTVAQPPPQLASQASGLPSADAADSNPKIYKWIKERGQSSENEIRRYEVMETHFPGRVQRISGEWVDIVVVTPESACRCPCLSRFN
jgi:hypothetical protein